MTKINKTETIKYLRSSTKKYKLNLFLLIFCVVFMEIVAYTGPIFMGNITEIIAQSDWKEHIDSIWQNFFYFSIAWLIILVGRRLVDFFTAHLEIKAIKNISSESFEYTNKHGYAFFSDNQTGSVISKLRRLPKAIGGFFDIIAYSSITMIVGFVATSIMLFFANIILFWIFTIFLILLIIMSIVLMNWQLKYNQLATKEDSVLGGLLGDVIANNMNVSVFASHEKENEKFNKQLQIRGEKEKMAWYTIIFIMALQRIFIIIFNFLIVYFSIKFLIQESIGVGMFVVIMLYLGKIMPYFINIGFLFRNFYRIINDIVEALEILQTPHEILDIEDAKELKIGKGEIVFENVDFEYKNGAKVFEKFNLKIKAGEKIGLVGISGSGKTTITKLLFRFFDLNGGKILIDNQDISQVKQESLRKNISFVAQEPILFHRSLLENIKYGNENVDEKEFEKVCKKTHCDEFVKNLAQGYETLVGERGIKLSGGQKQRVAIARAMLENSKIFVLDEATSALDSESEKIIQDTLEEMMQEKTSIVIAHRLSTIMKMDRIIVLENGKIIEEGKHNELLERKGSKYKYLWEIQAGEMNRKDNF